MINHTQHYESVVKDELAKACQANGIDKSEVGFLVGGFGAIEVVFNSDTGEAAPMPVWAVTVSLRHLLLGQPPKGGRLQVPGILPTDNDFRVVTSRLVMEVDKIRRDEFNGKMN